MNSGKRKRFTVTLAWQPMSTAPTDGTSVIAAHEWRNEWVVGNWFFDGDEWLELPDKYRSGPQPTHWLCETNSPID